MKKKNLILLALIGSVGAGVYYMGKNTILKKLQQNGYLTVDEYGKYVLTDKGNNQSVQKAEPVKMFDYNNPQTHAGSSYWLQNTVGIFYLPNLQDGKETGEYTELKLGLDGSIEPTFKENIITGIKSIIPFWK